MDFDTIFARIYYELRGAPEPTSHISSGLIGGLLNQVKYLCKLSILNLSPQSVYKIREAIFESSVVIRAIAEGEGILLQEPSEVWTVGSISVVIKLQLCIPFSGLRKIRITDGARRCRCWFRRRLIRRLKQ